MKLIVESDFRDYKLIKESDDSKPMTIKIRGTYIQCNEKNGNGRVYDYEMMKPEVDTFINDFVKTGRALGELEHPSRLEIDPAEACVRIISLTENERDKNWIGESIVLASDPKFGIKGTPKGDVVAALLNYGTKLGFSTRGCGEVNESTNEVTEFHLSTIDLVSNPSIGVFCDSNGNRYVNGILESKEFMINNHGVIVEKAYNKLGKHLDKSAKTYIKSQKNDIVSKAVYDFFKNISI